MAKRMTTVLRTPPDQMPRLNVGLIPDYVAEDFAQAVLKSIRKVYNDPAVQADFQLWKTDREKWRREQRGRTNWT